MHACTAPDLRAIHHATPAGRSAPTPCTGESHLGHRVAPGRKEEDEGSTDEKKPRCFGAGLGGGLGPAPATRTRNQREAT